MLPFYKNAKLEETMRREVMKAERKAREVDPSAIMDPHAFWGSSATDSSAAFTRPLSVRSRHRRVYSQIIAWLNLPDSGEPGADTCEVCCDPAQVGLGHEVVSGQ